MEDSRSELRAKRKAMLARIPNSPFVRSMGGGEVTLVKKLGHPEEQRQTVLGAIQPKQGFFPLGTDIDEGDVIEVADPRKPDTIRRLSVAAIEFFEFPRQAAHLKVTWGAAPQVRVAPVRRLGLEDLHPDIVAATSDLFTDGHYADAVFAAFRAVEIRVRSQSGLDLSGRDLMNKAFSSNPPPISVAVEQGQSGRDEQEGFRFLFMGAIQGIRNPKGHEKVRQLDAQQSLEYLGFASLLMRRLDDARDNTGGSTAV